MSLRSATRWPLLLLVTIAALAAFASQAAARSTVRSKAVVLVSGLDSSSPFSTPSPACASRRGNTWDLPNGIAPALQAAGYRVFTAPVRAGAGKTPPAPCGSHRPGRSTWLNSRGDIDANGAALKRFLAFLHRAYRVRAVTLIGHSDGGLWSQSAIARAPLKPTIQGLVTIGTPYTGSFVADIGTEVANVACGSADATCTKLQGTTQKLLTAFGGTAVKELTSTFMATWNRRASIARCGVTAIQGTAVDPAALPAPQPRLSGYYTPSDGLVGRSSGADRRALALDGLRIPAAPIPRLKQGGAFAAYHVPALGSPSELDDPAINHALVRALRRAPTTCAGALTHGPDTSKVRFVRVRGTTAHGGALGATRSGDLVVAMPGTTVSCGSTALTSSPLLPVPVFDTFVTGRCPDLTSSGAAIVLHDSSSTAHLTVTGRALRVRVTGARIRRLRAAVAGAGGTWKPVKLHRGAGTVPGRDRVDLRITGRARGGRLVTATGVLYKKRGRRG